MKELFYHLAARIKVLTASTRKIVFCNANYFEHILSNLQLYITVS